MNDELRDEYQFDYRQAKPNRFAASVKRGGRLVVLDPEVATVFQKSESVNAVLRALLQSMPVADKGIKQGILETEVRKKTKKKSPPTSTKRRPAVNH